MMNKEYKKYSSYKQIDHLLIKEAPSGWELNKTKFVGNVKMGQSPNSDDYNKLGIGNPFLQGNAEFGKISPTVTSYCDTANKISLEGDILFSVRAPVGALNISDKKYGIGRGLCALTAIRILPSFLWFALQVYRLELKSLATGSTYEAVSIDEVSNIKILVPSEIEQTLIARFLDQKTGQIDRLIEQKEKLLKLLAEKRTAIITRAVTGKIKVSELGFSGLKDDGIISDGSKSDQSNNHINHNSDKWEMKDSGIDLIGEFPISWKISKIKFNGRTRYGLGEPPPKKEDGLPFIRATDIYRGKIDLENIQFIDPDFIPWSKRPTLQEGEILVVRSGAYTGDSAIVTKECVGFIAGYDMVFTPESIHPKFLSYILLSKYMLIGQIYQARNRAAQPHLNAEELGDFIIALPSEIEQETIAIYLDKFLLSVDKAISSIIQSVHKLKEYREALITSAVTGQIKV